MFGEAWTCWDLSLITISIVAPLSSIQYKNAYATNVYRQGNINLPARMDNLLGMGSDGPDFIQGTVLTPWTSILNTMLSNPSHNVERRPRKSLYREHLA